MAPRIQGVEAPEGGRPGPAGLPLRILLVDDDDVMRETIAELLESEGYLVTKAESGRLALEAMAREPADLVFTDMKMPQMSGLDLVKEIRASYPGTYFVMVTGYGTVDLAVDAMKLGAFDFIQKPFKSEQVLGAVRAVQEERKFKEVVSPTKSEPWELIRAEAAAGSACVVVRWDGLADDAEPFAHVIRLRDGPDGGNGSLSGRDLFRIRERISQATARGPRAAILLEDLHRFLGHHAWPDVRSMLEKLLELCREDRGVLLVTADRTMMSKDQLEDVRKLLGSRFVEEVVDSLSSPMRRASLLFAEKGPAHFSDLMRAAGTDSSPKLAFHLRKLVAEGLLVHAGDRYLISDKGRQVLDVLRSLERKGAGGLVSQGVLYLDNGGKRPGDRKDAAAGPGH